MISLTSKEQEKIELLDVILSSSSSEQLKRLAEELKIVSTLSGDDPVAYVFKNMVNEHNRLSEKVVDLNLQLVTLQSTLDTVCRALAASKPTSWLSKPSHLVSHLTMA